MIDKRHTGAALNWLSLALGHLAASRSRAGKHRRPRIAAVHANQAAVMALKGAIALSDADPPRTSDLDELRRALPAIWLFNRRSTDLTRLSSYGIEIAYPGGPTPISPLESATAVRQAMSVVRVVREGFERRGVSTEDVEAG